METIMYGVKLTQTENLIEDGYQTIHYSNRQAIKDSLKEATILWYVSIKEEYVYGYESNSVEIYDAYFRTEEEANDFFKKALDYADYARTAFLNLDRIRVFRPACRFISLVG